MVASAQVEREPPSYRDSAIPPQRNFADQTSIGSPSLVLDSSACWMAAQKFEDPAEPITLSPEQRNFRLD